MWGRRSAAGAADAAEDRAADDLRPDLEALEDDVVGVEAEVLDEVTS
jgi:hypothetical protein